jgi:hypothetical protein
MLFCSYKEPVTWKRLPFSQGHGVEGHVADKLLGQGLDSGTSILMLYIQPPLLRWSQGVPKDTHTKELGTKWGGYAQGETRLHKT